MFNTVALDATVGCLPIISLTRSPRELETDYQNVTVDGVCLCAHVLSFFPEIKNPSLELS